MNVLTQTDSTKRFKILSVDGGGIRGLYAARVLQKFESDIQQEHGPDARIGDFVDLVCGTSTGGLIALGVAQRIPMTDIAQLYLDDGPKIFRNSQSKLRKIRQLIFLPKYSSRHLEKKLQEVFGDGEIGSCKNLLCIPTYSISDGSYEIFKFDHPEGNLRRHNKLKVSDVALATSAAPTYFPVKRIPDEANRHFVDGGVWANNPSLVGYLEALKYFVGEGKAFDSMHLLSISALPTKSGVAPNSWVKKSVLGWGAKLFDLGISGQSSFTNIFLESVAAQSASFLKYHRISSEIAISDHARILTLDNSTRTALTLLEQYALNAYHQHREEVAVSGFWKSRKSYHV